MNQLIQSSTNFQRVRDGRNSLPFWFDLDLTNARSVAAGTQQVIEVAGNAFYCDANPLDGVCTVHFQDTNFDKAGLPLYVSPGFIAAFPFTKLMFENAAQPGKKVRICYGVDYDFSPGSVAQIAVSNAGGYTSVRGEAATGFYGSQAALAANTADAVFTAGANVNGAILLSANGAGTDAGAANYCAFIAKATAPVNVTDGEIIASSFHGGPGAGVGWNIAREFPQFIPAGKGLYFIPMVSLVVNNHMRACRYKLL